MEQTIEMYQKIFEANCYPMWMYDGETSQFLIVNKAAIDHYGYSREEFLLMSFFDLSCKGEIDVPDDSVFDIKPIHTVRHRKKNGEVITVELGSCLLTVNGKSVIYNSVNDISELVKNQNALRESEESFRSLVENSEDMIMRFDREYRHLYANPVSEKFLGIKQEDFLGKNHEELGFSKEQYDYWDRKIEDVFVSAKATREVSEINAGEFIFHWDLIPEFDALGRVVSVLSITRDMTDIVKSKKALEESKVKLEESNAIKDKLFSIVAHDLRGPIGNLEQVLDIIINDQNLDEIEKKDFLVELLKASKVVNELLSNLLIWSKSQLNGVQLRPVFFNINNVIQQNVNLMLLSARKKEITLLVDFDEELIAYADMDSISVVVRNLISNAIKFTFEKGIVKIQASDQGEYIEVKVIDNGGGISDEIMEKLFKPNVYYTSPGTNNEKGSGLGLFLCKEFISSNNGVLRGVSVLGKGSGFSFTLPKK